MDIDSNQVEQVENFMHSLGKTQGYNFEFQVRHKYCFTLLEALPKCINNFNIASYIYIYIYIYIEREREREFRVLTIRLPLG
jgi:hypothetical protein